MSEANHIPTAGKNLELPLHESSPINIPNLKISAEQDDDASPCLPNTPPPTPETSNIPTPPAPKLPPTPPSYLTTSFIQTALRTKHPNIVVTNLNLVPAVGSGENYVTIVFRAAVETNEGPFHLILKCIPETEHRAKMANENGLTEREMRFYKKVLPIYEQFLPGDDHPTRPTTPFCYYTIKQGLVDVIVLKDLKPDGYRTANRHLGLDKQHCELAFTELAKLHALSIKFRIENPELFEKEIAMEFKENLYVERNRELFNVFLENAVKNVAKGIRDNFPYRYHSLTPTMELVSTKGFQMMLEMLQVGDDELNDRILVLSHGDFWSNNMLFQYDSPESKIPKNCCTLDFQLGRCGSPITDLIYFLFSSTTKLTRMQHIDYLLKLYFDQVYVKLEHLNIHKPLPKNMFYTSMKELKEDFKKYILYGLFISIFIMPVVVADAEDAPDMENINEDDLSASVEQFNCLYQTPRFINRFKGVLDDCDDLGLFVDLQKLLVKEGAEEVLVNGESIPE
ncbi:hypothetical protein B566_EDAN015305 [Ephemera danica]|nr:hypothetical protein B566_EDAN015305 [Ephemera danica]